LDYNKSRRITSRRSFIVVEALNHRRLEILRFLARCASKGETPPSVREVGNAVGLRSSKSAHAHLNRLESEGLVERPASTRGKTRPPRLTEKGWEAVLAMDVPLLGRIAAGRGLEAVAIKHETDSPASELLYSPSGKKRYFLRVVGQSMTGARIEDGDLLVVEEDESPPDGTVVAALLREGEEVTVKRLHREGDKVRLEPHNGDHEDIIVPAEQVQIQGWVTHVIHPPAR
jgi:repressor LexA